MRNLSRVWVWALAVASVAAWHAPAIAEELFPATMAPKLPSPAWLNRLEPAGGPAEPPAAQAPTTDANAADHTPAAEAPSGEKLSSHAEKPATAHTAKGSSEGQKSFAGKEIGAPPPLPKVTIGGQVVETQKTALARLEAATTPKSLQTPLHKQMLERRVNLTPYAHNPREGEDLSATLIRPNVTPRIQVIELTDLACTPCLAQLTKLEPVLQDFSSSIVRTHIHVPAETRQDTNLPAFYGKVAARSGAFWAYRNALQKAAEITPDVALQALLSTGLKERAVRQLMLSDARRFYRELDADTTLSRHFAISQPPVLLVNGIRLGHGGLPLDLLRDVLTYVQNRMNHGLEHPL